MMAMKKTLLIWSCLLLPLALMTGCDEDFQPLPVGQLRIELPAHEYSEIETSCPFTIEAPTYARMKERRAPEQSCWSDLKLPLVRGVIHLTYRELHDDLALTLNETRDLTYNHVGMADNILDQTVSFPDRKVHGTIFTVEGNVASNIQFYVTDSVDHFLRGALYFNTSPNKDSLAPVIAHVRKDIDHMVSSLRWKD